MKAFSSLQEEHNKLLANFGQLITDHQLIQKQLHQSNENLTNCKEEFEVRKCRYESIMKTQQNEIEKLLHENDKLRMEEAPIPTNGVQVALDDNSVQDAESLLVFKNSENLKKWLQEVNSIKANYIEAAQKKAHTDAENKLATSLHISALADLNNQQKEILNASDILIKNTNKELEYNNQIAELNSKVASYSNQNKQLTEEICISRKKEEAHLQKIAYLENAIQVKENEYQSKLKEQNYTHQSLLNSSIAQLDYEISNLKNQLNISEQSAVMLKEKIKMLQNCEQMYNSRFNELGNLLNQKEEQLINKSTENQALVIENTKLKGDLFVLNTQINSLQAKFVGIELENQKLNGKTNQENGQLWEITQQEYETILTAYKNKFIELQTTIANLEKENVVLVNKAEVCIRVSNNDSNELVKENEKLNLTE